MCMSVRGAVIREGGAYEGAVHQPDGLRVETGRQSLCSGLQTPVVCAGGVFCPCRFGLS